jgi:hypothetical protein
MKTATQIQAESHRTTLNQRAIDRLIQQPDFPEVWKAASDFQREDLLDLLQARKLDPIRSWFKTIRRKNLGDKSARDLIELCRKHKVPNYSRMQKNEMLTALAERGLNDR